MIEQENINLERNGSDENVLPKLLAFSTNSNNQLASMSM